MPPTNVSITPRKPTARSRVSNGSDFLPGIDQRSATARRYRDLVSQICVDAGADRMAEVKMQLIRRFSAQCVLAELLEAQLASGQEIDVDQHCQISSTLTRLAQRIGLGRHAKVVPSLKEYLAATASKAAEQDNE